MNLRERGRWRYPPPYDFYDDDGLPPLNPKCFYSVLEEDGAIAGFYFFIEREDFGGQARRRGTSRAGATCRSSTWSSRSS